MCELNQVKKEKKKKKKTFISGNIKPIRVE